MAENKLNDECARDNKFAADHDEFRQRLRRGWNAREAEMGKNWNAKYPYFAQWVDHPELKISIYADLKSGEASFKVWHTDKGKQVLLITEETHCTTEEQVYEKLDSSIKNWKERNGDKFPTED